MAFNQFHFESSSPQAERAGPRSAEPEYRLTLAGDIWHDHLPNPYSWANSLLIHLLVLTAILLPVQVQRMLRSPAAPKAFDGPHIALTFPEFLARGDRTQGGGGGGDRSPTPASRGAIPPFSYTPLAPPMVQLLNLQPAIPVQPALLGAPDINLPEMNPNGPWGDPTGVLGPLSSGPGTDGGIGTGSEGGVGPDVGGGYGHGKNAGYGGDTFSAGNGVSAPVPLYKPEPAYSEEARKAKLQGLVSLWIVVDPQGNVGDIRVTKGLGMGLDEKAMEAVRTWKFRPGLRKGVPVPVRVLVEVYFRLF